MEVSIGAGSTELRTDVFAVRSLFGANSANYEQCEQAKLCEQCEQCEQFDVSEQRTIHSVNFTQDEQFVRTVRTTNNANGSYRPNSANRCEHRSVEPALEDSSNFIRVDRHRSKSVP